MLPQVCHNRMATLKKITTLFNQVHAKPNTRKFNAFPQNSLWAEATNTTNPSQNNLLTLNRILSSFHQLFGKGKRICLWCKTLLKCVITHWENSHFAKLANHGTPSLWVGYHDGHPTSTYCIFNPKAKKILFTLDATFLQKSYRDYNEVENWSWSLQVMKGWMMMRNSKGFLWLINIFIIII